MSQQQSSRHEGKRSFKKGNRNESNVARFARYIRLLFEDNWRKNVSFRECVHKSENRCVTLL